METPGAVQQETPSVVCAVLGPAGLALDVVEGLLVRHGLTVVADAGPKTAPPLDVVVLVEPDADHWLAAQAAGVPIVLALGEEADDEAVVEAVLAGADAVVHTDTAPDDVVRTLRVVSEGGTVLAPGQARMVASVARAAATQPQVVLSRREAEIVASIAAGKAVKQTARDLGISAKTVENLQGRLFRKLGVRNRAQAVARAHELGLL